jgi:hypothetical protein
VNDELEDGDIVCWVQHLDNTSDDHIFINGTELSGTETSLRQNIYSSVSDVVKSGKMIFNKNHVQCQKNKKYCYVEVDSEEPDRVGRIAPIVCYTAIHNASKIKRSILSFASNIDRTFSSETISTLDEALKLLKQ